MEPQETNINSAKHGFKSDLLYSCKILVWRSKKFKNVRRAKCGPGGQVPRERARAPNFGLSGGAAPLRGPRHPRREYICATLVLA